VSNLVELIKSKYKEYEKQAVDIRRHLHSNPELGTKEVKTQQFIIDTLKEHGIVGTKIADTGVVALIKGTKQGEINKTILVRSDIDALPIKEETGSSFASLNDGVMHACGHDGHITNLLISAFILKDLCNEYSGNIKLAFQPAEESIGGAERMIEAGILENPKVDAAIGLHVSATDPANNVYTKYDGF
jgi:amidohydrolase